MRVIFMDNKSGSSLSYDAAWNHFEKDVASVLDQFSDRINTIETDYAAGKIRSMMKDVFKGSFPAEVKEWEEYGTGTALRKMRGYYIENKIDFNADSHRTIVDYDVKGRNDYYLYLIFDSTKSNNNNNPIIDIWCLEYNLDISYGSAISKHKKQYTAEEFIEKSTASHPVTVYYNKIIKSTILP